jgi:hypothetical protein
VKSGGCDPRIKSCREASVRRAFQNIICTPRLRSLARLVRIFFVAGYSSDTLLSTGGTCTLRVLLLGEADKCGPDLAAGVGDGGGQPGSNAEALRLLEVEQPCESRVLLGVVARSYGGRRRVASGGTTRSRSGGP